MPSSGTTSDKCINDAILRQYLVGTLDDTSAGVLEEHIQDCDRCRGLMVGLMDSYAQPLWLSMVGQSTLNGGDSSLVAVGAAQTSAAHQGTLRSSDDQLQRFLGRGVGSTGCAAGSSGCCQDAAACQPDSGGCSASDE